MANEFRFNPNEIHGTADEIKRAAANIDYKIKNKLPETTSKPFHYAESEAKKLTSLVEGFAKDMQKDVQNIQLMVTKVEDADKKIGQMIESTRK
jgi:type VII secretion effector (TIGR04197 family)